MNTQHILLTTGSRHSVSACHSTWPEGSGIYAIKNKEMNVSYIGSAVCMKQRWKIHRTLLRGNRHHSAKLQNAWNKYGESSFLFVALAGIDKDNLIQVEQLWLDGANAVSEGYNINVAASSRQGMKHSDETKHKMSLVRKGRKITSESEIMRRRNHKHSEEVRARISEAHKGKIVTLETRAKISVIAKARIRSPETRAKQSASLKAAHARRIANERNI